MVNLTNQELDDPFLWMGFNCFKAKEPLQGASLLFTTQFPEIPGTHLIHLRSQPCSGSKTPSGFENRALDWEFSTLTTRPSSKIKLTQF